MGTSSINGPFSVAMLNNQRVPLNAFKWHDVMTLWEKRSHLFARQKTTWVPKVPNDITTILTAFC